MSNMKFSEHLWKKTTPTYLQILQHPFIIELTQGSLIEGRFSFYLQQDSSYLIMFSKALAFIAGRLHLTAYVETFLNFSLGALVAERSLHAHFLSPRYHDRNVEIY